MWPIIPSQHLVTAGIARLSISPWKDLSTEIKMNLSESLFGALPKQFIMEIAAVIHEKRAANQTPEFEFEKIEDAFTLKLPKVEVTQPVLPKIVETIVVSSSSRASPVGQSSDDTAKTNLPDTPPTKKMRIESPILEPAILVVPPTKPISPVAPTSTTNTDSLSEFVKMLSENLNNEQKAATPEQTLKIESDEDEMEMNEISGTDSEKVQNLLDIIKQNTASDKPSTPSAKVPTTATSNLNASQAPNFPPQTFSSLDFLNYSTDFSSLYQEHKLPDLTHNGSFTAGVTTYENSLLNGGVASSLTKKNNFKDLKAENLPIINGTRNIGPYVKKTEENVKNYQMYQCRFCNHKTRRKQGIIDHERKHMSMYNFGCHLCDFVCKQHSGMKNHYYKVHSTNFRVELCRKLDENSPENLVTMNGIANLPTTPTVPAAT